MKKLNYLKNVAGIAAAIALVAGCGGGGGSSPAPQNAATTTVTVPFRTAVANLETNGLNQSFTISGTVDPSTASNPLPTVQVTGSGTYNLSTPVAATLSGVALLKATETITGTVSANGQSVPLTSAVTLYYNPSNYTEYAETSGTSTQLINAYTLPATIQAGSTGTFGTGTFSVAADSANSLLVTEVTTAASSDGSTSQTQAVFRITTTGAISVVSLTVQLTVSGKVVESLVFKF